MQFLFNSFFYNPLYNSLILLIDYLPGGSVGLAVILLTVVVKLLLFPLSASSIRTQIKMKDIDGELKEIKEKHKDNREEMGKKMLELYKENKINPFAGLFLIIIQIPVVIALYFVFRSGFPAVNLDILYSFVPTPTMVDTNFLNFIDLSANNNILVALLAGVSQYYQMLFVMKKNEKPKEEKKQDSPMEDIMKMMQFQMKYIMPIITFFISFFFVSVIGLYWFVSNLFAIGQEIYIQKKIRNPENRQK